MPNNHSDQRIYALQAEILRGLAHPVRLEILHLIGTREISFSDLFQQMGITQTMLSQHLAVMRRAGIMTARRDGARTFYRLKYPEIEVACEAVTRVLSQHLADLKDETGVLLRRVSSGRSQAAKH